MRSKDFINITESSNKATAKILAQEMHAEIQDLIDAKQGQTHSHHIQSLENRINEIKQELLSLGYRFDIPTGKLQKQKINEYHGGSWREIRNWVPRNWPDYVVKDFLYQRISDKIGLDDKKAHIQFILSTYPVKQWKLETRKFGIHSFEEFTQRKILMRSGGTANPDKVPRDKERHDIQQQRIQRTGEASQEPIIAIQRPGVDGLELMEGWHRTVQNIKAFPDGYVGRAWVGYI